MKKLLLIVFLGLVLFFPRNSFAVTYTHTNFFYDPNFSAPTLSQGLEDFQHIQYGKYFAWTSCLSSSCEEVTDQKNLFFTDGINEIQLTNFPVYGVTNRIGIHLVGINNGMVNWTEGSVVRSYGIPNYDPLSYVPTPDFIAGITNGKMVLTLNNGNTINLTQGVTLNGFPLYTSDVGSFKQSGNNLLWINNNGIVSFYNYEMNEVFFSFLGASQSTAYNNLEGDTFIYARDGGGISPITYRTFHRPVIGQAPFAEAGNDIEAPANQLITLDASDSSDPDGTIKLYGWKRLPDQQMLCSFSSLPTCQFRSLGRAEEVIELEVRDNKNNTATDTMSVFFSGAAPTGPVCGNSQIEAGEFCDSNSESCTTGSGYAGTMNCNAQCTGYAVCTSSQSCGDGIKNGSEQCDGTDGVGANQSCSALCTLINNPLFNFFILAKDMQNKPIGVLTADGGWNLQTNGVISHTVNFPQSGVYTVTIIARGDLAGDALPKMDFRINSVIKANISLDSTGYQTRTITLNIGSGSKQVGIGFTNDYNGPDGDRNIVVKSIQVTP